MRILDLDKDGYLNNLSDWDEDAALQIAKREEIKLTHAHWEIIKLLRKFYKRQQVSPATRALINLIKRELGPQKGRSVYLMKLFRGTPAKTVSKISGLPKPDNCI
tara:strand:- start:171 stop:485 length:315 start_codon:yes stop_codon:yes gene_type:complete